MSHDIYTCMPEIEGLVVLDEPKSDAPAFCHAILTMPGMRLVRMLGHEPVYMHVPHFSGVLHGLPPQHPCKGIHFIS